MRRGLYCITVLIMIIFSLNGLSYGSAEGDSDEGPEKREEAIDLSPRTYSLGGFPRAAAAADLDSDGDPDIIVTNPENHNIAILLNRGDGTFETGDVYPIEGYPIAVISRDIDNDSDIDLVVLDSDGMVRTLLMGGDRTFSPGGKYPVPVYSFSITSPDVDSDGDPDLIVLSSKVTAILINDGKGGFGATLTYPGSVNPQTGLSADLTYDGRDDMVAGDKEGISVLLNNGDNSFAKGAYYATGRLPVSVTAGDIDSDLDNDLVVANYKSHTISILRNDGEGQFGEALNLPSGKGPNSITLSDIDSDGDPDILVTNGLSGEISILINNTVRPLEIATDALPQGQNGLYYETGLEARGGVPPYRWEVVSGSLPPTVYLDPETGEMFSKSRHGEETEERGQRTEIAGEAGGEPLLSLTPPCLCLRAPLGLYRFTVRVTDSASATATADLYIEVMPRPGTVSGRVSYSGEKRGAIRIGLLPESRSSLTGSSILYIFSATITTPGEYKIDNVFTESYLVSAFMDVNGDGLLQGGEPYGVYGAKGEGEKPGVVVVDDDGTEVEGIDIELVD